MDEIKKLEEISKEVINNYSLSNDAKKYLLALIGKEILEIRKKNQEDLENSKKV